MYYRHLVWETQIFRNRSQKALGGTVTRFCWYCVCVGLCVEVDKRRFSRFSSVLTPLLLPIPFFFGSLTDPGRHPNLLA
jgi:hypothetical protein